MKIQNKNFQKQILAAVAYCLPFIFVLTPWYRFLLFCLGVLLGIFLLIFDEESLFQFYQDDSQQPLADLENNRQEGPSKAKFIVTRSTLFLLTLIPLSLFVVTSTGSAIGSGFTFGIMLGLLVEMWLLKNNAELFGRRYLNQLAVELSEKQINLLVVGSSIFFAVLNLWVVLR